MRKALVIGIDYYDHVTPLHGCVNDSYNVKAVLERNSDGSVNFDVKHFPVNDPDSSLSRSELKAQVAELFRGDSEVALFYFSGHGYVENSGGYLITTDSKNGDEGLQLEEILRLANESQARNKILILDSCHSGALGSVAALGSAAVIEEGVTILSASGKDQYALEVGGSGVFTTLFVDAMQGGAADLMGHVTPGSVYAHIDQSLGPWEQRPVFKTNVKNFTALRRVTPPIPTEDLRKITTLFEHPSAEFALNPSFEPEGDHQKDPVNMANFKILQAYNRVNLVIPVSTTHMYHAAMESRSCRLTALGAHYWNLVQRGRI